MNRFRKPVTYYPFLFWFLESLSLILVGSVHNSICVQAREVSSQVYIFIIFIYSFILTDLYYMIISFCIPDGINRPFGIIYNMTAGVICFIGSIVLASGITFCGNRAQKYFLISSIFGLIASLLHVLMALSIRDRIPFANNFFFSSTPTPKN